MSRPGSLHREPALAIPLGAFKGRLGRASLFETTQAVGRHAHAQYNVMINVGGADETYEVDGFGACRLTRDRLILLNPWMAHANKRPRRIGTGTVLSLFIDADWGRTAEGLSVPHIRFAHPSAVMTADLRLVAQRLAHRLTSASPVPGAELEAMLQETFSTVLGTFGVSALFSSLPSTSDSRIRRAAESMKRQAQAGIDIAAVCREVGLSRTRFYNRFQACLGVTPRLFMEGLRFDAALTLMAQTGHSLVDISSDLGFPAPSHFTRFFREKTGLSPSAFRRSLSVL